MMSLLKIEDLTVEFPGRHGTFTAVRNVSLHVERGEILGLVGESGAGKSTVGAAVMGLLQRPGRIAAGRVLLDGQPIHNIGAEALRQIRGRRIGMIFQDPLSALNPVETVGFHLTETILRHLPLTATQARDRAVAMLDRVGIRNAAARLNDYPHQFSGGMRQRVVIALALCAEPELVIADEPTTALDVSVQAQVLRLLRELCRDMDVGMVLVTHDMGVIAETTDRVAVMYRGDLIETGPTAQLLARPGHAYTQALLSAVPPADRRITRFPNVSYIEGTAQTLPDLKSHWLGERTDRPDVADDLSLSSVSLTFGRPGSASATQALNAVSFDVRPGETFGLVGESGSGKSTTARVITGLHRPDAGAITFRGQDLLRGAPGRGSRRNIQMVFQDPYSSLNPRMRVGQIVAEPIVLHRMAASRAEAREIAEDLLAVTGLGSGAARKYPHEFSGGQRQRIAIARALATRPTFLICDEPTSALDVSVQAQILNLLKDLQDQLGLTMLFVSHDLPVIRQMCDRVGVMRLGALEEVAETEQLFRRPQSAYARHLLNRIPRMDRRDAPPAGRAGPPC